MEFEPGCIWLVDYPVSYFGNHFNARTTLIRGDDGALIVHSPCPLTDAMRAFVAAHGGVGHVLAPGTLHHLHAATWHRAYPDAGLYVCPGLERKRKALADGTVIADGPSYPWSADLEHVVVRGNWIVREVAFHHRASRTLLLTDLIENFTDDTPCNWQVRMWFKLVLRMWNRPRPAPEYRLGWLRRAEARACLERVMAWDFQRIVPGHGEPVLVDARAVAERAFAGLLR